jgi:hypothetical protein
MKIHHFIGILFFLNANFAISQVKMNNLDFEDSAKSRYTENTLLGAKTFSPFGSGKLSNFLSNISLSSFFKEGVNGKIEFHGKFDSSSRWSEGLSIDQKIGKDSKESTPLDLTGVSPGTTVEFNLLKMFWNPQYNLSDAEATKIDELKSNYAKRTGQDWRTVTYGDLKLKGTEEEKKIASNVWKNLKFKQPLFLNLKAGFTKTSFSYATDSTQLKEIKNAFITPTFTGSLIKVLGHAYRVSGYIALSYNYSQNYKAGDEKDFLIPFGSTGNFYTSTLAFGKPTKKTSNNLTLEWRENLSGKTNRNGNVNLAVSPSVTMGIDSKKLSIIVPLYFIKGVDEKGKTLDGLQGGMRFGYITSTEHGMISSFKDGFTAQLIVSAPLDFLKQVSL